MTAPLTPERMAEAWADLATVSGECGSAVAWTVTHDPLGTHVEHGCGRGRLAMNVGTDHPHVDREALARLLASVPDLLAEVERLTERAERAEREARDLRLERQVLLDERVEVGALRAALNTEEMEPYRDLAHYGKQAHRLGEARAALARVEALATAFEQPGAGFRGVAVALREAMEGKP